MLRVVRLVNVINVHMILAPVIIYFYANSTTVAWELSRLLNAHLVAVLGIIKAKRNKISRVSMCV